MTISKGVCFVKKRIYQLHCFPQLVLRVYKDKGSYAKGMTWTIPEHKLDKALAAYRKQEHTFKQRIKKAAIYLSPRDAEVIILLATHNIVQLELMISPIQIREKPYYL